MPQKGLDSGLPAEDLHYNNLRTLRLMKTEFPSINIVLIGSLILQNYYSKLAIFILTYKKKKKIPWSMEPAHLANYICDFKTNKKRYAF